MRLSPSLRRLLALVLAAGFVACGGDDDPVDPDPTPTPPNAPTGVTVVSDAEAAVTISWSTVSGATSYTVYYASQAGVTKSNYSGLPNGARVTNAVSPLDITALPAGAAFYFVVTASNADGESSESSEASVTPLMALRPAADMQLSPGTHDFTEVDVPAGVTVTATGSVVLRVSGDASIGGTITGDCQAIEIRTDGAFTLDGLMDNVCTGGAGDTPPGLKIVADGDVRIGTEGSAQTVLSSDGLVRITDTATESEDLSPKIDVEATPAPVAPRAEGGPARQAGTPTRSFDAATNAAEIRLSFDGNISVGATVTMNDGAAGPALAGSPVCDNSAGAGRPGGDVYMYARGGTLTIKGTGTIKGGKGGTGGACVATGDGAVSIGGPGGRGGGVYFGGTAMVVQAGATITRGDGGDGGQADATGDHASVPCMDGSPATATGGKGGRAGGAGYISENAPTIQGNPMESGANGGTGGVGKARGGDGASCICEATDRSGGDGAEATALGGQGGDGARGSLFTVAAGTHKKGQGGDAEALGGFGGAGADCCDEGGPGGDGGAGGAATATGGAQGDRGTNEGKQGKGTTFGGDGGEGGDGTGPGAGGAKGVITTSGETIEENEGSDGLAGEPCPGAPQPVAVHIDIGAIPLSGGVIAAGSYQVPVNDASSGSQLAAMTVTYPNGGFLGSNPDRTGLPPNGEVIFQSTGLDVGGQSAEFQEQMFCFVNSSNASTADPITIESLDANMNVIGSQTWPAAAGAPGATAAGPEAAQASNCVTITREESSAIAYVLIRGISGGFIDIAFFQIVWLLLVAAAVG